MLSNSMLEFLRGTIWHSRRSDVVGLGGEVTVLDRSLPALRALDEFFDVTRQRRRKSRPGDTDVVVGAVLAPGAIAPRMSERKCCAPRKGSVVVDAAIYQNLGRDLSADVSRRPDP